jgi:hypothetical protein
MFKIIWKTSGLVFFIFNRPSIDLVIMEYRDEQLNGGILLDSLLKIGFHFDAQFVELGSM